MQVWIHRYLKKSRLLKFVMCRLLGLPFPRSFLRQPLTVLTRGTSQGVCAINQSISLRCLCLELTVQIDTEAPFCL
jgi:hypothetical protein